MNYFDSLYTLVEIAINNGIEQENIATLSLYMNKKDVEAIHKKFPKLSKFIPYCKWYVIQDRNVLAMSAYIYDMYKDTGILPNLDNYDYNPDRERLEHWQYVNPLIFEINPETGFEFAKDIFKDCNIWSLFLSGSARMNFYEGVDISLEQRIKFAIIEYMVRRQQFYTTEDFIDNPILHKKYKKEEK